MFQGNPKLVLLSIVCVLSVGTLLVVCVGAMRPDEATGLRAGTWTSTGPAESVAVASAIHAGDARLGELVSFVVEAPTQLGPNVNLTLNYRDGTVITTVASSEMQPKYLQSTIVSTQGVQTFVTFRQTGSSQPVEVTDGLTLARFSQ